MNENTNLKGFVIINLADMLTEIGEGMVKDILLSFLCPLNKDVEYFLHKKSIEFSKQSLSRTHLIFCSYKSQTVLAAYFTLANKFIQIDKNALSNGYRKRITKFGSYDTNIKKYIISAPLIAQLGKNFKFKEQNLISGDELLKIACDKITEIQFEVGGSIAYLECEDVAKLKEFYTSNGFIAFGKRELDSDEKDDFSGNYLMQMVKYLHRSA